MRGFMGPSFLVDGLVRCGRTPQNGDLVEPALPGHEVLVAQPLADHATRDLRHLVERA